MSKAQRLAHNALSIRTYIGSKEYKVQGGIMKEAKHLRDSWCDREPGAPAWAWRKANDYVR